MAWRRLFLALLVNLAILALTYVGFNYGYNEGGRSAWFAIPSYIIGMVGLLALLGLIAFAAIYALTRAVGCGSLTGERGSELGENREVGMEPDPLYPSHAEREQRPRFNRPNSRSTEARPGAGEAMTPRAWPPAAPTVRGSLFRLPWGQTTARIGRKTALESGTTLRQAQAPAQGVPRHRTRGMHGHRPLG